MNDDPLDAVQCVLVVEDEVLIALATEHFLLRHGYRAVLAFTAQDAFDRIGRDPGFDFGMIDLKLSNQSGVEVIDAFWARWPGTPVLVVTAYADFPGGASPVLAGPLTFLSKPWNPGSFALAVQKVGLDPPALVGWGD